jgi:acyl-CoA reductase-like NAD-dependent aldehyde dehydrogenase
MTGPDYTSLVAGQRAYFKTGHTRPVSWRVEQLNAIKTMIDESRDAMYEALWHDAAQQDRGRRVGCRLESARRTTTLDHLHEWMKPEHIPTPLLMKPGHVRVRWDPLGVTPHDQRLEQPYS